MEIGSPRGVTLVVQAMILSDSSIFEHHRPALKGARVQLDVGQLKELLHETFQLAGVALELRFS